MLNSTPAPKVSVILPVRDGEDTLKAALQSLIRQTFEDWELIVVDDGSADGSAALAESLAAEDSRMRVLRRARCGLVPALNAALDVARGGLIGRMDADDWAHPERLALQVALLEADPSLGVASCLVEFGGDGHVASGLAEYVRWSNSLTTPAQLEAAQFIESALVHPTVVFRRELISRFGGYLDGDFPEDYEMWLRWFAAGVRMAKVERPLLVWHDSAGRLTRTDPRYSAAAFYRVKCEYLLHWLERSVKPGRPVWLWGAGRVTRKRFSPLIGSSMITGFIDVDPKKMGRELNGLPVIPPAAIPADAFVITAVGSRDARQTIVSHLRDMERVEGLDFIAAA